jgi:type II secretory pathway component PulJ
LEVLVALTILGLSLAAIFAIFSQSLSREHVRDDAFRAQRLAQSLIAEAITAPTLQAGARSGKTEGLSWQVRVAPYAASDDWTAPGLHTAQVNVRVTWPGMTRPQSLTLSTLRLMPREQSS